MQCQAKAKSTGKQCRRHAVISRKVCRVHGGATPRGIASPHFKTGRHSRDLPTQLSGRYLEAITDAELLSLRDDIALVDTRISELLDTLPDNPKAWDEINELIETRRRLADSERRRLVDLQQMMTAEQAMTMMECLLVINPTGT
jgi:flagellar motility protein MotE (MotC chaperone)